MANRCTFHCPGALIVMDPSYSAVVRRSPLEFTGEFEARQGEWVAVVELSPEYDGRVSRLLAYHSSALNAPELRDWEVAPFKAGVDTGLLGVFAADAVPDDVGSYNTPNGFYASMLGAIPRPGENNRPLPLYAAPGGIGAFSETGFGDGFYDVFWRRGAQGRIESVQVVFLDPRQIARHDDFCRANGIERLPPGTVLAINMGPRMLAILGEMERQDEARNGAPHGEGRERGANGPPRGGRGGRRDRRGRRGRGV